MCKGFTNVIKITSLPMIYKCPPIILHKLGFVSSHMETNQMTE